MDKNDLQTLLVLADRARGAGLISFSEMPAVLQAINAANEALKMPGESAKNIQDDGKDVQTKAGKRESNG